MREESNLLTTPWQAKDDYRKHGRDRSTAERRPRPSCRIGRDACDQLSFPKVTLLMFAVFILIAVSNASSSSLHLKHWALRNRYVSLGIERQFFKMKDAWYGSISSRFSIMLSSTLIFAFKWSGADSWCRGDASNCHWVGSGIERDGNWSWKSLLVWGLLMSVWLIRSSSHLELLISRPIEDKLPLIMLALVSIVCGFPPIHPSSRYQMFRSALILDVTSLMTRAKRAGPRGSPCCTPVAESRLKFPWKRGVFEE